MLDDVAMNLRLQVFHLRPITIWAKENNAMIVISDVFIPRSSKSKRCPD